MKYSILIFLVCFIYACSKDDASSNTIIGEWKQVEVYNNADVNPWQAISDGFTLIINKDSTYTTTRDETPLSTAGKIRKIDNAKINIQPYVSSSTDHPFNFTVDNTTLQLTYSCVELCGMRFKRVH